MVNAGPRPRVAVTLRGVFVPALAAAALLACGDGPTDPPTGDPGITIVSGDDQSGVINTALPEPVVIDVHDGEGAPAAGVQVVVGVAGCSGSECHARPYPVGGAPSGASVLTLTTSSAGRATFRLQLDWTARNGTVPIVVPALGFADEISFVVLPGPAVGLRTEPSDTAVYVGATAQLRVAVIDEGGNALPDAVTYTSAAPEIATVGATGLVQGVAHGRTRIDVAAGDYEGFAELSVVPAGTAAAARRDGTTSTLLVYNLDGSSHREVTDAGALDGAVSTWSPDGQTLVYTHTAPGSRLRRIPAAGGISSPLLPVDAPIEDGYMPAFSADGEWVYFTSVDQTGRASLWRVHPDGTGLDQLSDPEAAHNESDPSPSPDGTRLAFMSNEGHEETPAIRVLTLATGEDVELPLTAWFPSWSPDGEWIAYWADPTDGGYGSLNVMRPDGTDARRVSRDGEVFFRSQIGWSPDGEWLLAPGAFRTFVVRVSDGLGIPLPFTQSYDPAWRP
jgi:hypothetical protein